MEIPQNVAVVLATENSALRTTILVARNQACNRPAEAHSRLTVAEHE